MAQLLLQMRNNSKHTAHAHTDAHLDGWMCVYLRVCVSAGSRSNRRGTKDAVEVGGEHDTHTHIHPSIHPPTETSFKCVCVCVCVCVEG